MPDELGHDRDILAFRCECLEARAATGQLLLQGSQNGSAHDAFDLAVLQHSFCDCHKGNENMVVPCRTPLTVAQHAGLSMGSL